MRKAIAAVLGLPIIGALYLGPISRRSATLRLAAILVAGGLLTAVAVGSLASPTTAYKTPPIDPVATARLSASVQTDYGVHEPVLIDFSAPMDKASVGAALRVEPFAPYALAWSDDARTLTISPRDMWQPATLYTVSVDQSAADSSAAALGTRLSAVFVTRARPTVQLTLAGGLGVVGSPYTELDLVFSSPVERDSVAHALTVTPVLSGTVTAIDDELAAVSDHFRWVADKGLQLGTAYTFTLAATVHDTDGVTLAAPASLDMQALGRPTAVRSRPAAGATKVALDQAISVRFTRAMDRISTQAAFHLVGFDVRKGTFSWAERDTVLIWRHQALFGYGSTYTLSVDGTARAKDGIAMGTSASDGRVSARFTTAPRPVVARPKPAPVPRPTGSTTSAPWYGVEKYYLNLINCTHTGGWVSSRGTCSGRGTNGLAPLRLSADISNRVTRPWAKYLAQTGQLYHGCPGCRLAAAGYTGHWWGENLAWWSGDPYQGAIQAVLFFQGERSSNGGHWRNMMDPRGHSAGVGVWRANGRTVYNIDFWAL